MPDRTAKYLGEIPELYAQIALYREPGSAPPDPDARAGTGSKSRPAVDLAVVDLTDTRLKPGWIDLDPGTDPASRRMGVQPTLWLWYRLASDEMEDTGQDPGHCDEDTVTGLCSWLARHADWIRTINSDFPKAVRSIHRDLSRGTPPYEPDCPDCGWPVQPQDRHSWWSCTGCPRTWQHDSEIRRLMGQQPPMPLRQIAPILGVSHMTLHRWFKAGRFLPAGKDSRGNLFHLEVIKRAQDTIAKERSVEPLGITASRRRKGLA